MKVRALRRVYNRSESKEYQAGQVFDVGERAARVLIKLRKVESIKRPRDYAPAAPSADEEQQQRKRRYYRRRDVVAEE